MRTAKKLLSVRYSYDLLSDRQTLVISGIPDSEKSSSGKGKSTSVKKKRKMTAKKCRKKRTAK